MSTQDMDQIRDRGMELLDRAKNDPKFVEQIKADPRGTLTAAGLPASAVAEFLVGAQEHGVPGMEEEEVAGYAAGNSCAITFGTCCGRTSITGLE
jgi:hypothetical protein